MCSCAYPQQRGLPAKVTLSKQCSEDFPFRERTTQHQKETQRPWMSVQKSPYPIEGTGCSRKVGYLQGAPPPWGVHPRRIS